MQSNCSCPLSDNQWRCGGTKLPKLLLQKLPEEVKAKAFLLPHGASCFLQRKHSFTLFAFLYLIPVSPSGSLLFFPFDWHTAKQRRVAATTAACQQSAFSCLCSSTPSHCSHYKAYFVVFWWHQMIRQVKVKKCTNATSKAPASEETANIDTVVME